MSKEVIKRIDDLGRVAIPKEFRKDLNINEGEPVSIRLRGNQIIIEKEVADDNAIKVGDRVEYIEGHFFGLTATVLKIDPKEGLPVAIEFDGYIGGHSAGGLGTSGYCWYTFESYLKRIPTE